MHATIVALATPPGQGALAVVRLSGPDALVYAARLMGPGVSLPSSHRAALRRLWWEGQLLDHALVLCMHGPRSFTGEDVVELHLHGGYVTVERCLNALHGLGVRSAEPGEMTRRALENGKVDLLQAEAIGELIGAQSTAAHQQALEQLGGGLSRAVEAIRAPLLRLVIHLEASIDFGGEEHVGSMETEEAVCQLDGLIGSIDRLLGTYQEGRRRREGVGVAIVGPPNAGKSTLLNLLLGEERALVSHLAGTTRDTIEEIIQVEGWAVRLIDTAGLRETDDHVEKMGIARARARAEQADALLVVLPAPEAEETDWSELLALAGARPWAVVWNHADRLSGRPVPRAPVGPCAEAVMSLHTGEGVEGAGEVLRRLVGSLRGSVQESALITRARHRDALADARLSLMEARASAAQGLPLELVALDARASLDALGRMVGAVTTDDILHQIFEGFCIGK